MTATELETARRKLGLDLKSLAIALQTPYRTVQDWQAGRRPIPGVVNVAVALLVEKDARFMANVGKPQVMARPFTGQEGVQA